MSFFSIFRLNLNQCHYWFIAMIARIKSFALEWMLEWSSYFCLIGVKIILPGIYNEIWWFKYLIFTTRFDFYVFELCLMTNVVFMILSVVLGLTYLICDLFDNKGILVMPNHRRSIRWDICSYHMFVSNNTKITLNINHEYLNKFSCSTS